jgi:hypothetical protein
MKKFSTFKLYSTLLLLFVITVVVTILVGVAWSVVSFAAEGDIPKAQAPAFPQLAADWQKQIDVAMSPSAAGIADVTNPFVDRRGISGKVDSGVNAPAAPVSSNVPAPRMRNVFVPGGGNVRSIPSPVFPPAGAQTAVVAVEPALTDNAGFLNEQMSEQERRALRGDKLLPVTEIYGISDLRPLGGVGAGRRREVLFDSPVTKQSFSVPVGTRFRDGVLESVSDDGVFFRRADGSTLFRSWATGSGSGKNTDKGVSLPVSTGPASQTSQLSQEEAPLTLAVRKPRRLSKRK